MRDNKNFKKIANSLELVALYELNVAIKKYTDGQKVESIMDERVINVSSYVMSDEDHMRYAMAHETLTIIKDNGVRY